MPSKKVKADNTEEPKKPRKKPGMKRLANGQAIVRLSKNSADLVQNPSLIKEWDDEELLRGQRKDKNGRFSGKPPRYIPQEVANELANRKLQVARQQLVHSLTDAVDTLVEIAKDKNVDAHARVKASNIIIERILGKPKENIKIESEQPEWLKTLQVSIVSNVAEPNNRVIDVESTAKQ